jgi:hypothetical protein
MKEQLIENLKTLARHSKECPYLSMQVDIPGKVILKMGRYITQDEMDDLLAEFGNHAGLSYRISINAENQLTIEIFVGGKKK